jgi:hypothetical protein
VRRAGSETRSIEKRRDTMSFRTVFYVTLFFTLFTAVMVLLAACNISPKAALESNLQSIVSDVPLEQDDAQPGTGERASGPAVPEESLATPQLDALSIMDSHCSSCHVVQNLEKLKKSRAGWERALAKMERGGVRLSDAEKAVLIDYLATSDEP